MGVFPLGNHLPPLAILVAPENCRYHAVSKVLGSQILWLSLLGVQPLSGSRRGRTIESQLQRVVYKGWGQRLIKSSGFKPTP